jgi:hypothetical protein
VVGSTEPNHLEGEGFLPKVGRIPKSNKQVNLPKGQGLLPLYDAVERCSIWAKLGPVDPHGVKGLGVHDVEVAASIHQYLSEPRIADDGVNNKWVLAQLWDVI